MGNPSSCVGLAEAPDNFLKSCLEKLNQDPNHKITIDQKQILNKQRQEPNGVFVVILSKKGEKETGVMYRRGIMFYYGEIKNKRAEGQKGICFWKFKNGNEFDRTITVYEGQFVNNMASGKGKLKNQLIQFDGEWKEGSPKTGHLKIIETGQQLRIHKLELYSDFNYQNGYVEATMANQWKYMGEIRKSGDYYKFHGKGEIHYISKGGGKYEGQWEDGNYHGIGKYIWTNVDKVFKGQYYKGIKHGQGVQTVQSKISYIGKWKQGKKDGLFTVRKQNDNIVGPSIDAKVYFKNGVAVTTFN